MSDIQTAEQLVKVRRAITHLTSAHRDMAIERRDLAGGGYDRKLGDWQESVFIALDFLVDEKDRLLAALEGTKDETDQTVSRVEGQPTREQGDPRGVPNEAVSAPVEGVRRMCVHGESTTAAPCQACNPLRR